MRKTLLFLSVGIALTGCKPKPAPSSTQKNTLANSIKEVFVGKRTITPQEVKQSDGSVLCLEAVTFGKDHKFKDKSHRTVVPVMVLWISHEGSAKLDRHNDDFDLVCIDSTGQPSGVGFLSHRGFRAGDSHSPKYASWEVPAYPRDEETFTVRISEFTAGSTTARYQAEFSIRNNRVLPTAAWKPQALPATNRQGEFELVLHDLTAGSWTAPWLQRGGSSIGSRGSVPWGRGSNLEHLWTRARYSITRGDKTDQISQIKAIEDPLGNVLTERLCIEKGRSVQTRHVLGMLPLEQSAWKITFVRDYEEDRGEARLVLPGILQPKEGEVYSTNLSVSTEGVKIELESVAGPNGEMSGSRSDAYRLGVRVTVPARNVGVQVASVTDPDGNELENPFVGSSGSTKGDGPVVYERVMRMRDWPAGAKQVKIVFQPVWKRQAKFEFTVKPPKDIERVEPFDATRLKGEYTAIIDLQRVDGSHVGGKEYVVSYEDPDRGRQTVATGTTPEKERLRLSNLAGGKRALKFSLISEGKRLGSFTLEGDKEEQEFTFRLAPQAGEMAPPLPFVSLHDAEESSLAAYRGQYVFIDFWTTWCGPCQAPMTKNNKILSRRAKDWKGKAAIISVSLDDAMEKVEKHVKRKRWNEIPHYWVKDGWKSEHVSPYAISGVPTCLLIDPQGQIIWRGHPSKIDIEKKLDDLISATSYERGL